MLNEDRQILTSWRKSGSQWIQIVDTGQIVSRAEATNAAILSAITALSPSSLLDVGCGEGWLCRAAAQNGMRCTGIDAVAELIDRAIEKGGADYLVASYEALVNRDLLLNDTYDLVVFNFSLFAKQLTGDILAAMIGHLNTAGHLLIQTVHPDHIDYSSKGRSHWVTEHWNGFSEECVPFDWYFRIQSDWDEVFEKSGLKLVSSESTCLGGSRDPFSIVYFLQRKGL